MKIKRNSSNLKTLQIPIKILKYFLSYCWTGKLSPICKLECKNLRTYCNFTILCNKNV